MRPPGEVHFISDIETEPERAQMAFESGSRIKHAGHVVGPKIVNRTRERRKGGRPGVEPEIEEAPLHRKKRPKGAAGSLQFWPEQPVQDPGIRALQGHGARPRVCEPLDQGLRKVIAHFRFELEVSIGIHREMTSHSGKVHLRLREAEIVRANADLTVLLRGRGRHKPSG